MALAANDAIRSLYGKALGSEWAFDWGAGLTAPITEETAKASGLLLLIALAPRLIGTPFDGLIAGAFIGLGFQIIENVTYVYSSGGTGFGADQLHLGLTTVAMRMAAGIASHWVYSGIFCAGLIYLLGRPGFAPRRVLGLGLMFTAMLGHGVWDSIAALTAGTAYALPAMVLVVVALLVVFSRVYKLTARTEHNWMRDLMAPEVPIGVISEEELDVLAGSRKQRRKYLKGQASKAAKRTQRNVLEAAGDLADQLARDHGTETEAVMFVGPRWPGYAAPERYHNCRFSV